LDFQSLILEARPTVIISDIEGGEKDLFYDVELAGVRHVFLEVHKSIIGLNGIAEVASALGRQGLYYDPDFSVGAVVMFSKASS
jgi:ABC-type hemin transport system substrate-binding protein